MGVWEPTFWDPVLGSGVTERDSSIEPGHSQHRAKFTSIWKMGREVRSKRNRSHLISISTECKGEPGVHPRGLRVYVNPPAVVAERRMKNAVAAAAAGAGV